MLTRDKYYVVQIAKQSSLGRRRSCGGAGKRGHEHFAWQLAWSRQGPSYRHRSNGRAERLTRRNGCRDYLVGTTRPAESQRFCVPNGLYGIFSLRNITRLASRFQPANDCRISWQTVVTPILVSS
jgi:hypothetical protein